MESFEVYDLNIPSIFYYKPLHFLKNFITIKNILMHGFMEVLIVDN